MVREVAHQPFELGSLHFERPEDALIRELAEELGIAVKAPCLAPLTFASHAYEEFHLLMPLYVCRKWEGFVAPAEGQAVKWVRARELRNLRHAARRRAAHRAADRSAGLGAAIAMLAVMRENQLTAGPLMG